MTCLFCVYEVEERTQNIAVLHTFGSTYLIELLSFPFILMTKNIVYLYVTIHHIHLDFVQYYVME